MGRAWDKSETESNGWMAWMEHGGGCPFGDLLVSSNEWGSPSQIILFINNTSVGRSQYLMLLGCQAGIVLLIYCY